MSENLLFLSDLQLPFEHSKALQFATYLKRHFKIQDENCYCVGDETDQYFGGLWEKSPEAKHTPHSELKESIEKLKEWYKVFPKMKLATSNHGTRWMRKASAAQIPSQLLRRYEDIIEAPDSWIWKKHWKINTKRPILMEHGDDWGGQHPHISAAIHNGMNTVMGHFHSLAGVEHIKTNGLDVWGMVTGSLIDFDQYAFEYAQKARRKPQIGCGVVLNSGRVPLWLPLD